MRDGLQPRIGERSAELGEPVPRVYLFPSREDCDTALCSWLGECFDGVDEGGLVILCVDLQGVQRVSEVPYEITVLEPISPARILSAYSESWEPMSTSACC